MTDLVRKWGTMLHGVAHKEAMAHCIEQEMRHMKAQTVEERAPFTGSMKFLLPAIRLTTERLLEASAVDRLVRVADGGDGRLTLRETSEMFDAVFGQMQLEMAGSGPDADAAQLASWKKAIAARLFSSLQGYLQEGGE